MVRRSISFVESTPFYGFIGEPNCITIKMYYGGIMKSTRKCKEYTGGAIEYFDFVDSTKLSMVQLWGFVNELGFEEKDSIRFWHKFGADLTKGRYLASDVDVPSIKDHIPSDYEVEIYIENDDGRSLNVNVEDKDGSGSADEEEEEEYQDFYDSDYDFEEDDRLFDDFVDHDIESCKGKRVVDEIPSDILSKIENEEVDEDCVDSDDLCSLVDSDDGEFKKYPVFDPIKDAKHPELKIGMIFSSKREAKFAIESHCIRNGKMVKFVKNDNLRLRGKCPNKGCKWLIHVSTMSKDSCWQIKTFEREHSDCFWIYTNKNAHSSWLGKTFAKKFKSNSKLGTSEFRQEVCKTLKINISDKQAYLAKKKAVEIVEGNIQEQFSKIRNYCAELKRVDEAATVILKLSEDTDGPRFQRMYVCFSACRDGFKEACRPFIGVDGCFLKGKYGGQLLAAVGLDPNNNIFPVAYALVEGETKDSWMWFLRLLDSDIGFEDQYAWTFMSDKQKGLIPAFESLFPDAENRFCVRHLHSNMKVDGFRGVDVKNALWAAAKATTIADFRRKMEEMKEIDEKAYEWLAKKPEQHWSRSHFTTFPKCDVLLNNMCECFNSYILYAREKPIILMFESIRNLLMVRFQMNREKAEKWDSRLCPKIKKLLAKISLDAARNSPMKSDNTHFQIMGHDEQHTVDLGSRSCSCRKWDLTGIPCQHAMCAIWCNKEDPEDYVHHYYGTEAYRRCYTKSILPINGPELWPECNLPPPLPPVYKGKVGRPAKLRRRERDELPASSKTKLRGVARNNKCNKCGEYGHNKRTCTGAGARENQQEQTTQQSSMTASVAPGQPSKRKKLPVRKPASQAGAHIEGSSNIISSINVNPVFVKGGVNFVTVSKLKDSLCARRNHGQSISTTGTPENATSVSKTNTAPMTSKEKPRTLASQASVSRT